MSLQKKIFVMLFLLLFIILFLFGSFFFLYISNQMKTKDKEIVLQRAQKIASEIGSMAEQMDLLSSQIIADDTVQHIMNTVYQDTDKENNYFNTHVKLKSEMQKKLLAVNSPKSVAKSICVFNDEGDYVAVGYLDREDRGYQPKKEFWYQEILEKRGRGSTFLLAKSPWLRNEEPVIAHIRLLQSISAATRGNGIGYVAVQQPYELIEGFCAEGGGEKTEILITDREKTCIYPLGEKLQIPSNTMYVTVDIPNTSWQAICFMKTEYSNLPIWIILLQTIAILAVFGGVLLVIAHILTKRLTKPVQEMKKAVEEYTVHYLPEGLDFNSKDDEIRQLYQAFNRMIKELDESTNRRIQAQVSELQAYLLAVQSQINPHFLYNILACISAMGVECNSKKIPAICSDLSALLRYSSSMERDNISVGDEIIITERYLKLMAVRFEEQCSYMIQVEDAMMRIPVPKMVVQPIVENSFRYAFENSTDVKKIIINGYMKEHNWVIEVWDNGCGMSTEEIENVYHRIREYSQNIVNGDRKNTFEIGGMGLANIFVRLYLRYQEKVIFKIETQEITGGTKVTIGGPVDLLKEGVKHVSSIDR